MLCSLYIENIAVIKSLSLELGGGFTVLTGGTGAGKSVIIDAISMISGAKAQPQLIRTGEERAKVSALFTGIDEAAASSLAELGVTVTDGELEAERTFSADGKSTARLGGKSVSQSTMRRAMAHILSINGQSESLSLKTGEAQLALIDDYSGSGALLTDYGAAYAEYTEAKAEVEAVEALSREGALTADLLSYQLKEIDAAKLRAGEEEELRMEAGRLRSGEKITKLANYVYRAAYLNEKGASASYLAERAASALEQLTEYSPDAASDAEKLRSISYELEDIARRTYRTFDLGGSADRDPAERLEEIEDRLDLIRRLERKYGADIPAVLAHRAEAAKKLDAIENNEERLIEAKARLERAEARVLSAGAALSACRREGSGRMTERICEVLEGLDMPKVKIEVRFTDCGISPSGLEDAEIYISANAGEDVRPLALAASGGELSRVMLAIKSVGSDRSGESTIIYDEIDTGVSGSTSGKIGRRLRECSRAAQIICVTHSAQIASLADTHLLISKHERDGRTETTVTELSGEARIDEIARIIGGINVTETQKKAARELITEGRNTINTK